jgi:hypothetical protein
VQQTHNIIKAMIVPVSKHRPVMSQESSNSTDFTAHNPKIQDPKQTSSKWLMHEILRRVGGRR